MSSIKIDKKEVNKRCQEAIEQDPRVKAARAAVVAKVEDKAVLQVQGVTVYVRTVGLKNPISEESPATR